MEYNLTLYTSLKPLNSETYNSSFTVMNYAPADKSGLTSLEFVEFNSPVTLSQQYAILGKVAKEVGKVYEKSGNETLAQLAKGYYIMEEEAKVLSKLVEKQLQEYDREILESSAILMDASVWDCFWCAVQIVTTYFGYPFCTVCASAIVGCVTPFGFWWCLPIMVSTCGLCIIGLAQIVQSCYLCGVYLGIL